MTLTPAIHLSAKECMQDPVSKEVQQLPVCMLMRTLVFTLNTRTAAFYVFRPFLLIFSQVYASLPLIKPLPLPRFYAKIVCYHLLSLLSLLMQSSFI